MNLVLKVGIVESLIPWLFVITMIFTHSSWKQLFPTVGMGTHWILHAISCLVAWVMVGWGWGWLLYNSLWTFLLPWLHCQAAIDAMKFNVKGSANKMKFQDSNVIDIPASILKYLGPTMILIHIMGIWIWKIWCLFASPLRVWFLVNELR